MNGMGLGDRVGLQIEAPWKLEGTLCVTHILVEASIGCCSCGVIAADRIRLAV